MNFAYADPPYYGYGKKLYGARHPLAAECDSLDWHRDLIARLVRDFPDGWALSMTSGNLHDILPLCPRESRIMAWTKPFAIFKPNVGLAYAWEPVVFMGGRKITRGQPTVRDWCAVNITLKKGLTGAKPKGFCDWLFSAFNAQIGDELTDIFPGTGGVTEAWNEYQNALGADLV